MIRGRNPFGSLWSEVNQMQDEFQRLFGRFGRFAAPAGGAVPLVNVWEDDNALFAEADLPGLDPATLDVFVTEGNQLTIQGERTPKQVRFMILGLDPILVFRDEDFGRFMNMDNAPSTPRKGRR